MDRDELIEILADYERAGWVICALPPGFASVLVGNPATQEAALVFSAELKRRFDLAEATGVRLDYES